MRPTVWFQEWFGREYLALYPHRDRAEARQAVNLLQFATGCEPGAHVLDVGCGPGRHLVELNRIGYRPTGLDLSERMLDQARRAASAGRLVRGDMRALPFCAGAFDLITSYFTTFGYFDDASDDGLVLREVGRTLKPGGFFLLDFMNRDHVVSNLRARDRRTVSGVDVIQERRLVQDASFVEKSISIRPHDGRPTRDFLERVRLYRPMELDAMLTQAGLFPKQRFGTYARTPFTSASPRYIVIARAGS